MYVVDSSARKATITLTGEEVAVKFPCTYSVFGIKGDSMLLYPKSGMAQGDDGVYDTAEGDGSVIMCLHYQSDTVYIKGTGDCVIWAGNSTLDNPFKVGGKGGGGSGGGCNYKGTTTTAIENGSTTNPIVIDGEEYTAVFGDIVVYGYTEFVFDGTAWSEFGRPFDTTPTSGSANAVTSNGVYAFTNPYRTWSRGSGAGSVQTGTHDSSTGASGTNSLACGYKTIASQNTMVAIGAYNRVRAGDIFSIGCGNSGSNRKNIVEVNNTSMNVNGDIQRNGVGIDDYTTTERKIGKWIDGSDLYQRTFEVTTLANDNRWHTDALGTSGIDIVDFGGYVDFNSDGNFADRQPLNAWISSTNYINMDSIKSDLEYRINRPDVTIEKAVITIKYTKPSEQANIQQTEESTDEMR